MSDLRLSIAEFRAWCRARGLSHRYVCKEAANNSRIIEVMERQASRNDLRWLQLRRWMEAYDRTLEERDAQAAEERRATRAR